MTAFFKFSSFGKFFQLLQSVSLHSDYILSIVVAFSGNVSRLRLALILITMDSGGHVSMPGVEIIECTAYRLEPITSGSFNDLDGEVIEAGIVQGSVLPGAIQVYCRPN